MDCYLLSVPENYEDAIQSNNSQKLKLAMDEEMKSLELNDRFKLVDLPGGIKLVSGKWVYSIKSDPDNPTYKASYVAKDYS